MSEKDERGTVIEIDFAGDRPPALVRRPTYGCRHTSKIVDANARRVTCRTCEAVLDPIDVLDEVARDGTTIEYLRRERAKLSADVEKLQVEVKRLKDAKRRHS